MSWHYERKGVDIASEKDYTAYVWVCSACGNHNHVTVLSGSPQPVFVKCSKCGVSFEEDCKNDCKRSKAEN